MLLEEELLLCVSFLLQIIKTSSIYINDLAREININKRSTEEEMDSLAHDIHYRSEVKQEDLVDGAMSANMILEGWSDGDSEDEKLIRTEKSIRSDMRSEDNTVLKSKPTPQPVQGKKRKLKKGPKHPPKRRFKKK